jgi:hypothetical protein
MSTSTFAVENENLSPWSESSLSCRLPDITANAVEIAISRTRDRSHSSIASPLVKRISTTTPLQLKDELRRIDRKQRHLAVEAKKANDAVKRAEEEQLRKASAVLSEVSALTAVVDARIEEQKRQMLDEQKNLQARIFRDSRLLRKSFDVFFLMNTLRKRRLIKADRYYKETITFAILTKWFEVVKERQEVYHRITIKADAKLKRIAFARLINGVKKQKENDAEMTNKLHRLRKIHVLDRWFVSSAKMLGRRAAERYRLEAEVELRFRRSILQHFFFSWVNALEEMKEERESNLRQQVIINRALSILNEEFNC